MSRTLVLGANGFIGSHLVDRLAADGHTVRAFDRFGNSETKFNSNDNVEIFSGDFLNKSQLEDALRDIDYVFHFISTTTPATAENDPMIDIDTNIRMSVELFQLCVKAEVKRVLFASTGGAIYGEGGRENVPHQETDQTLPISPYAIGKLAIENYLRYFRAKHQLNSTVFRISNPYGERQPFHRKQGVIPIFLENIYRNHPITVLGDGSMVRDYIYVKDVASMISSVFENDSLQDVYNLGSGGGTSLSEIIQIAESVTGKNVTIEHEPVPPTFVHSVVLDTSRFMGDFNIKPETNLSDGMTTTYEYIKHEIDESDQ
ncbi:MAG TPA: NAD-dependent epimerase/dehydratase family protein [Candidatus Saccharibacteria bacterium]|nr:NAD-dependent epimerase/dehydratase family protein [Candidatus Saccharibacteria bacterium]HRQ97737.1 NAD-dependent epimerase/dehydratase family protein [Candidatus Saccharibacteria bacterium]